MLALWVVAGISAAALAAVLLLRDTPRDHVSAYIERVNETQQEFATRYGSISVAYTRFDLASQEAESQVPRLRSAAETLTALREEVAAVEAPEDAAQLRLDLIRFLRQQEAIAWELVHVVEYLPKLAVAEKPLQQANATLRRELTAATTPDQQAAAVSAYAKALERVAAKLDAIPAPPLLQAAHATYVARLRSFVGPARRLERAVAANDIDAVNAALQKLQQAGEVEPASADAQRKAIESYNARVARVRELGAAVERERVRLDRALG